MKHLQMNFTSTHGNDGIPRCSRRGPKWLIEFDAFLGAGDPPADIGQPSDLFFDGEERVFARTFAGWEQWIPVKNQTKGNSISWPQSPESPGGVLAGIFLTHNCDRGVLWATLDAAKKNAKREFEHASVALAIRTSKSRWPMSGACHFPGFRDCVSLTVLTGCAPRLQRKQKRWTLLKTARWTHLLTPSRCWTY